MTNSKHQLIVGYRSKKSIKSRKMCRWCDWYSNPGPQEMKDWRRRRNHWAMTAPKVIYANNLKLMDNCLVCSWYNISYFKYKISYFLYNISYFRYNISYFQYNISNSNVIVLNRFAVFKIMRAPVPFSVYFSPLLPWAIFSSFTWTLFLLFRMDSANVWIVIWAICRQMTKMIRCRDVYASRSLGHLALRGTSATKLKHILTF